MDKQTDRAKMIAELKKPLRKWPGVLIIGLLPMCAAFLASPVPHDMAIAVVFGCSFGGAVGFLVAWIFRLQNRVEALTSMLLEQQDK